MDIKELAQRFHALFAGMEQAHGTYAKPTVQREEDGKLKGEAFTLRKPVTDELWERHLSGVHGLGVIPIREDSTCMFGGIDIDVYADLDHGRIAATVERAKLKLIPCRSKSGGCHLYLFCESPVPAAKMQDRLRDIAAQIGFGTSEIFPKQTKVNTDRDLPGWLNMPYFAAGDTVRYAVRANGDVMTAEEFLAAAEASKVPSTFFDITANKAKKATPNKHLPDGPPCLQHLMEMGFPEGTWNVGTFNLGIYCRKAYPADWRERLVQLNAVNFPVDKWPVSDLNPAIASLAKKDYQYQCSVHPLVTHCNKVQCRSRKYGVGGTASGFPILGGLRKLSTVPPAWFWDVTVQRDEDDVTETLELSTEDLQSPDAFQRRCMERINVMPIMPSRVVWAQTVQVALKTVTILEPPPEDSSTEGQFWELLEQFCSGRAQANSKDEIFLGKPWTDTDGGRTYFRTSDLTKFLQRMQFKEFKLHQITKVLKMRKGKDGKPVCAHKFELVGEKGVNLWSVPMFAKRADSFVVPDSLKKEESHF